MAIILIIIISLTLSLALFSSILTLQLITALEEIRLEAVTDQATFKVEILWMPSDIGNVNNFEIHFIDPDTGIEIEDLGERVTVQIQVTPEFQSQIFVLSAAALGLAVLAIAAAAQVQRQQFI